MVKKSAGKSNEMPKDLYEAKRRKKEADELHKMHRERMRKKCLKYGLDAFEPHEKVEYLLYAVQARHNTNPLAHELIQRFGSFSGVLDAPYEELVKVKGIGKVTAAYIKMIPEIARCYEKDRQSGRRRLCDYQEMGEYLSKQFIGLSHEVVVLLLLDSANRILFCDVINEGNATTSNIYVQKVVSLATRNKAVYAVLSHNHPSGVALPSRQDLSVTSRVFEALRTVDILLIDHIIVAGDDFTSIRESELLPDVFSDSSLPMREMRAADDFDE